MKDHTMLECTKHYSLDMYPDGQVKVNRKSTNEQIIIRGKQGNVGLLSLPIPKMTFINNKWEFENYDPRIYGSGAEPVRLHNELLMEKDFLNRIMSLFFSQVM